MKLSKQDKAYKRLTKSIIDGLCICIDDIIDNSYGPHDAMGYLSRNSSKPVIVLDFPLGEDVGGGFVPNKLIYLSADQECFSIHPTIIVASRVSDDPKQELLCIVHEYGHFLSHLSGEMPKSVLLSRDTRKRWAKDPLSLTDKQKKVVMREEFNAARWGESLIDNHSAQLRKIKRDFRFDQIRNLSNYAKVLGYSCDSVFDLIDDKMKTWSGSNWWTVTKKDIDRICA